MRDEEGITVNKSARKGLKSPKQLVPALKSTSILKISRHCNGLESDQVAENAAI